MVQTTVLGLVTLALSSYGSPDMEGQSLENLQENIPGESGGQAYELEPRNLSLDFWHEGKEATLEDFELYGRGPFGQAVRFSSPRSTTDLPVLTVPRENLHDSPLDIKGKGKSVSMVVWLLYERGNHAIAGMWHEGTVTPRGEPPVVKEPGKRQFGLFAGLQANKGGIGAHISENGGSSFGNIYARHLASEPTKMKQIKPDMKPGQTDKYWNAVGMVFNNDKNRVTAYVNGSANEVWVENPKESRFFEHAYRAWQQGQTGRYRWNPTRRGCEFSEGSVLSTARG